MGGLIAGVVWVVLAFRIFRRFFCGDGQGWGMLAQANRPAVQDGLESLFGADSSEVMKAMGLQREAIDNGIKASDTRGWFRNLIGRLEIRFVFALSVLLCMTASDIPHALACKAASNGTCFVCAQRRIATSSIGSAVSRL